MPDAIPKTPPPPLADRIAAAREVLDAAIAEHRPAAVYAAFSGGDDSIVTTHLTMEHVPGARPLHINTGIGLPAAREHVRRTCAAYGWDLLEERTPTAYEDLVLGRAKGYPGGFPGPAMPYLMYQRLKQRAIEAVGRRAKAGHSRRSRVLIVSGIRHDESRIRAGYQREVSRVHSQIWVNPLYWASFDDFRAYMQAFGLPRNPVKDQIGISGECCCGCFACPFERIQINKHHPEFGAYLDDLERRVRAAGFPWGWDERPPEWWLESRRGRGFLFDMGDPPAGDFRPMCNACGKAG